MPGKRIVIARVRGVALVAAALSLAACRDVAPAFGPSIPAAGANAEGLFGGIAQRLSLIHI